jgi:lipopolysaccharide export LptBFGC system permease protein LptF
MLAVAGAISIIEFRWLTNYVESLIQDNYKSIEASKSMLEALEREDSGILLLMLGEWQEGSKIIQAADSSFMEALKIAENNLTEENEDKYINKIKENYTQFKENWQRPIAETDKQGNLLWYKNESHKLFANTKNAVTEIMNLNQKSMYKEASELKEKSKRAIMHGIVSILAALIFSLLLNFFITRYFVRPISQLNNAIL